MPPYMGFIVVVAVFIFAVWRQSQVGQQLDYQCEKCGAVFELSPIAGALAPHSMQRKLVRCPTCGAMTWASPVPKA